MVTLKLAFRKVKGGTWLDYSINAFSGFGGYSHVELVFSDGTSFSSSSRDEGDLPTTKPDVFKKDGTRFLKIDFNPEKWDFIEFQLNPEDEQKVKDWCYSELDARYDFLGCARFVVPFIKESPDKWFCSEVCVAALQQVGLYASIKPWKVSPNALYKMGVPK